MAPDRTLILLKPDGVRRNLLAPVTTAFTREGLSLLAIRMERLSREQAEEFYAVHRGQYYLPRLLTFMTSGPIVAMVWAGENAVARARAVMGTTDWQKALPGTIRAEYSRDITRNVVHGSDSDENAAREIAFFFAEADLATVTGGEPEQTEPGQ